MGFFNWAAPAFGAFADRWSPRTIDEIAEWLKPFVLPDGRLLDVGGGTGALGVHLHDALDANVTVLDPTPEMLRYIPVESPVRGVLGVAEEMPFEDNTFDAVISTDAFHHFPDQAGAIREFTRVVRPGGGVVVVDFDPSGIMRLVVAIEKLLDEPGHFLTPSEMCSFMKEHGISGSCAKMRGVSYRFVGKVTE